MLRGKLFHQALTEAIWGTVLAHGVRTLLETDDLRGRSSADLEQAADLFEGLLATVTEARRVLVEERNDLRSNYTAWLICAGISSAQVLLLLGHDADPESWLDGPSGLWAHVEVALHDDGWEWEAATYYHYFVLRAYLLALRGRVPTELPAHHSGRIVAMLRVLVDLSTDGGVLPVLHDGPYRRPQALQELLEVYVLGRQLVDLPGLAQVEAGTRVQLDPAATSLEDRLVSWFAGPALHAACERAADLGELSRRRSPRAAVHGRSLAGRGRRGPARRRPRPPRQARRSTSTGTARSGSPPRGCRPTAARCVEATTPGARPTRP